MAPVILQSINATLYLVLFYISGFVYISAIYRTDHGKFVVGASIVSSYFVFVLVFLVMRPGNPWIAVIYALMFSLLVKFIFFTAKRKWFKSVDSVAQWRFIDILILGFILSIFAFICIKTVIHDDLNHFSFASQIMRGKFPPSVFAFPELEAKYHYGWAILLANFAKATSLPLYICSDILTLFGLGGCASLLLALFHRLDLSTPGLVLGSVLFFFGGGIFSLVYQLLYATKRDGLTLLNMFHQHPWVFGVSLYLLILHRINEGKNHSKSKNIICILHITPFIIIIPVVNATSGPFVLLLLFFIVCINLFYHKGKKDFLISISLILFLVILLSIWPHIGGMLVAGSTYDKPVIKSSLSIFSFSDFLKYEIAYILLLAPASFIVFLFSAWKIIKQEFYLNHNITISCLIYFTLFLFPLPILIIIENSAYWDNFSKISYFSVLSSWIVIAYMLDKHWLNRIENRSVFRITILILLVGISLTESAIFFQRTHNKYQSRRIDDAARQYNHLLYYFKNEVSLDDNTLLLNKNVKEMYPVSTITNKPEISIYRYLHKNFGAFEILALYAGVSLINFYDYNFFYNRSREYKLRSTIDSTFSGDASHLFDWKIDHVLCLQENCPEFLDDWLFIGVIALQATNQTEGWNLYRTINQHSFSKLN